MIDCIFNEDCLSGMGRIPDGSIDAIICDLPYEVLHKNNPHAQWDRIIPFEPLWEQYLRVTKRDAPIILFAQGMFTAQLMTSQPDIWRYNLVWDKMRVTGFLNANRMPLRCHEDICIFYRELPVYNPQMQDLKPGQEPNHPQGEGDHKATNQCYGQVKRTYPANKNIHRGTVYEPTPRTEPTRPEQKFPRSIIEIKREHESSTFHPTQKPVDLLRYLIRTYSNEGDVILDNCMGSGTTAVACVKEHRHFIGFETNKEYFDKACARVKNEQSQLTIF